MVKLGLISLKDHPSLHSAGPDITWRQFMCDLMHIDRDSYISNVKQSVFSKLDHDVQQLNAIDE
jgi:hypothetical protein